MGFELDQLDLLPIQLPPVRTTSANDGATEDDGCATPTSSANMLRAPLVPPPAPRKPRPAKSKRRKHCHCYCVSAPVAARYYWIVAVPHDLPAMFVARRPSSSAGDSLCRPSVGKKIRVHVLG